MTEWTGDDLAALADLGYEGEAGTFTAPIKKSKPGKLTSAVCSNPRSASVGAGIDTLTSGDLDVGRITVLVLWFAASGGRSGPSLVVGLDAWPGPSFWDGKGWLSWLYPGGRPWPCVGSWRARVCLPPP
ncbi:hypothetical protein Prum_071180 [Phytohabitans rumicis]|uniref:Uncharacterized protein n=1 Tax=Phytohabitans rumicis TaxID=1076125 RepID=A0A6V8LHA2_9ACTN|nr:hypothetical protein Prum_071180 [Phytohabitans rumicis]